MSAQSIAHAPRSNTPQMEVTHAAHLGTEFDPDVAPSYSALARAANAVSEIGWPLSGPRASLTTLSFRKFCVLGDALMDLAEFFESTEPCVDECQARSRALRNLRIDAAEWDAAWAQHTAVMQ